MTMQECYKAIGGNYEAVLGCLHSEALIQKFTLKFLEDQSYLQLKQALENKNYEEAFRAAHTIKGICQNLNFTRLLESSSEMSEALRHGWTPKADTLIGQLSADYQLTVDAIKQFQEECVEQ